MADVGIAKCERCLSFSPPDILCEFCECPLCDQCVHSTSFGSCCRSCCRKVDDNVCTERGISQPMQKIANLVTEYGDASFDCGEHSDGDYSVLAEKLKTARKRLMDLIAMHVYNDN